VVHSISAKIFDLKITRAFAAFIILVVFACSACKHASTTAPPNVTETVDREKEALTRVEQDRGEPTGRNATVKIPEELSHYANRHRFLAVQAADLQPNSGAVAVDFADLVPLIEKRGLVEMKPFGDDYILYGVGQNVSDDPFEHYDSASGQSIVLVASEQAFKDEVQRAWDQQKESTASLAHVEDELRRTSRRARARRSALSKEAAKSRKELSGAKARSKLLSTFYSDPKRRKSVLAEYQLLADFARYFDAHSYDLSNADDRRRFKIRLLSFIRPEARDALVQIAHAYKQEFDRPLPVSSLMRPVQYQRELAATNANAARGPTPPHSTGLAFDLYYGFMTAAEQEYLMKVIARLKDEGRVEALREARDNIHVYVFGSGRRPDEKLIARAIAKSFSRSASDKSRASSRRKMSKPVARKRR
jgi:uncharacterized protein DUF5715